MVTPQHLDETFLLTPKLIYFAVGSVYYTFYIFRVHFCDVYYGFDTEKAGVIAAVMSLAGFVCMPLWSWLADRTHSHRLVLMALGVLATATFELLLFKFDDSNLNYWYARGVFALFGGVLGGLLPLADFQILQLLTKKFNVSRTLYGRQRMMGTVSYSLTTWLVGSLIDWTQGVRVLFYLLPICSLILVVLLLAFGYPDQRPRRDAEVEMTSKEKDSTVSSPPGPAASSTVFFRDFHFVFFLFVVFITGCGRQVLQVYLPPFLNNTLHMTKQQVGGAVISSSIFSVIFLFIGSHLIRFFGTHKMLVLGMIFMSLRLGLYLLVPHRSSSAWLVYSIELLNGVAFSFTHLAGVKTAADFAPEGLEATAQAVYTSAYMQLPAVLISFVGGVIYKQRGPLFLFSRTAMVLLCVAAAATSKFLLQSSLKSSSRP